MKFYSPLRYPGSKRKLSAYVKSIFRENELCDGTYVEPYAGGAAIVFDLLYSEYASKAIINDKDRSVYSFWYSVLNHTDEICKLIYDTPITVKTWDKQREIQKDKENQSELALGYSTFFMNRANRSGIITAGIIGGRSQSGKYKIDARFNKEDLINRIIKIANFRDRISIRNLDAVDLIKDLTKTLPKKSLIFFDPPYFVKGQGLYLNHYSPKDHEAVAKAITKLKKLNWIVTYDNVPEIKSLYSKYRQQNYTLNYSASTPSKGQEVMMFSNSLKIPSAHEQLVLF
ncbi:MAG: DNA adenine methylase [Saprospiraceae bacterium]|nr:DNA adenine methylase [Saprospiraceae bacterium]